MNCLQSDSDEFDRSPQAVRVEAGRAVAATDATLAVLPPRHRGTGRDRFCLPRRH